MSDRAYSLPTWLRGKGESGGLRQLLDYWNTHYGRALFWLVFVVPTTISIIFYGFIASDQYISESSFIVRSVNSPGKDSPSAFLQGFGITRTNDDTFAIHEFLQSRDAIEQLSARLDLRAIYSRPESDIFTRYGSFRTTDSNEAFYKFFKSRLKIEKNLETGITTFHIAAYRAADAKAIADILLVLSERRVNQMNARARRDALSVATQVMSEAEKRLADANINLTRYRNQTAVVDPKKSVGEVIGQASELDDELAQLRVTLSGMVADAPSNPAISAVRQRIAAIEAQLAIQQARLSGSTNALAGKLGGYEGLLVRRELAEKAYTAAEKELQAAREEATRQQIYIETVDRPNLPDKAQEPRRVRYIFTTALLAFWAFLIFYLLLSGSREHLNLH